MLARVAGLSCGKEVRNLMLHSGKRPDVAILGALRSIITDFGLLSVLTQGTAPLPPSFQGTGPFGVLHGRTKPGFATPCRRATLPSRCATRLVVT